LDEVAEVGAEIWPLWPRFYKGVRLFFPGFHNLLCAPVAAIGAIKRVMGCGSGR
jgi:hypothetical protein